MELQKAETVEERRFPICRKKQFDGFNTGDITDRVGQFVECSEDKKHRAAGNPGNNVGSTHTEADEEIV